MKPQSPELGQYPSPVWAAGHSRKGRGTALPVEQGPATIGRIVAWVYFRTRCTFVAPASNSKW
jgi:hypothetical protein